MIDIKHLREHPDDYQTSADRRGLKIDINQIADLDNQRTKLLSEVEGQRAKLNVKDKPTPEQLKELQAAKAELEKSEKQLKTIENDLNDKLKTVPNLLLDDVPVGKDDTENKVLRKEGEQPKFDFQPKEHWQLGAELGVLELERAAAVAGSRFAYLKGGLAKLQFALISFVINELTSEDTIAKIVQESGLRVSAKPFTLVVPPAMIRSEVLDKMARLEPKEDRYQIADEDLYLSGSAEHTLGPLHMNETLSESDLPIRYLGYATAFRREAGSYGKDVRGILRQHQFDKLEMESFTSADDSLDEQNFLVAVQEHLLRQLKLPYQVVAICSGDMGDPDARQIDIETWMPGQNKYRETHTADLMTDYQSRRLGTRVRRHNGEVDLAHMNDGTAAAIGRLLIAIMENYQTSEGRVEIPEVLQTFYGATQL